MNQQTKQQFFGGHDKFSLSVIGLSIVYVAAFFMPLVTMDTGLFTRSASLGALLSGSTLVTITFATGLVSLVLGIFKRHGLAFISSILTFLLTLLQVVSFSAINSAGSSLTASLNYVTATLLLVAPLVVFVQSLAARKNLAQKRRVVTLEGIY